jgi:hypothetical protein
MINSVSKTQVLWQDGQLVDMTDMIVEQDRNVAIDASIIQNHFGSGVIPSASLPKTLFDTDNLFPDQVSLIASHNFDGTGLQPAAQPTDNVQGNQLQIELSDSTVNGMCLVAGRLSVKVLIIGLDFQGNIQYDRLYFYRKETQVTKKHYSNILSIFFNDFLGNQNCSRELGGRIIVKEASDFQLSRDPIMIAQDVQPNIFFRDFRGSSINPAVTLYNTIQAGIGPAYSVDALDINTTTLIDAELAIGDVTTRLSEKFLAKSNNIQKITILLGIRKDTTVPIANYFDWSGELIVSVYALQTTVSSPSDLVPGLAIEFEPNPIPITQFSLDQASLKDRGYILSDVLQPVDFPYNNSVLGSTNNPVIVPGQYYAISIGRAGDSSVGTLFTGIGNSQSTDDRFSIFTGQWIDVPAQDMWYQVWSDTVKVSDGQAYDNGNGIQITKTTINELGAVVDYALDQNPFADTGQNTLNTAIIEAIEKQTQQEQDERTGNSVFSRQQFEPSFSFVTNLTLATLRESSDPLIIGCARDANAKINNIITGTQNLPGLASGNTFIIINPNTDLISQQLIGSELIPNNNSAVGYSIVNVRLCTDGYGDVNGDGSIDSDDRDRATQLLGQSLLLSSTQSLIAAGVFDTLEIIRADVDGDGYITSSDVNLISDYVSRVRNSFPVGSSFTHVEIDVQNSTGRFDGYYDCDGYIRIDGNRNIINPNVLSSAELGYYGFKSNSNIAGDDFAFSLVPFIPVTYVVKPIPFWQDYMVQVSSKSRLVQATFSSTQSNNDLFDSTGDCSSSGISVCQDLSDFGSSCDPGKNDYFVPNNLIIGEGQILDRQGNFFKQDLEIGFITLELPRERMFNHAVINVFQKFILDSGNGLTSVGYPAAKFADCSTVQADALLNNQVRFGVSIQSIFPNQDGYDSVKGYGIIIDNVVGVNIDQSTGLMILTMNDIENDSINPELRTKILITIYLKKAGWNNAPLVVPSNQVVGLFSSGVV